MAALSPIVQSIVRHQTMKSAIVISCAVCSDPVGCQWALSIASQPDYPKDCEILGEIRPCNISSVRYMYLWHVQHPKGSGLKILRRKKLNSIKVLSQQDGSDLLALLSEVSSSSQYYPDFPPDSWMPSNCKIQISAVFVL